MHYRDKKGGVFEIRMGGPEDIPGLLDMYALFRPKGRYQGLPPLKPDTCRNWINRLFDTGCHQLALRDHHTIGHAALLPDLKVADGEYLVFVHQDHRGLGIGTALTRCTLDHARDLGLATIWLTVDGCNLIAIRLYRKCGFDFCGDSCWDEERKMTLIVRKEERPSC